MCGADFGGHYFDWELSCPLYAEDNTQGVAYCYAAIRFLLGDLFYFGAFRGYLAAAPGLLHL